MIERLGPSPFDFIMNAKERDLDKLDDFVHRTFNTKDLRYFIKALKHIYITKGGLENIFIQYQTEDSLQLAIHNLKNFFFELPELTHEKRNRRHIGDPKKGSPAKRINLFLRWMIRKDKARVDLGIWSKNISQAKLSCPLDVHSGNTAREYKLIQSKQNNAKALKELDTQLRIFDPSDPVKYDFALFGLGFANSSKI